MKGKLLKIFAGLIILIGLGVFLYPLAGKYLSAYNHTKEIDGFKQQIGMEKNTRPKVLDTLEELYQDIVGDTGTEETRTEEAAIIEPVEIEEQQPVYEKLYQDFQLYNQQIYENGQSELKDPFDYQSATFDLSSYGLESDVVGVIWIPRMEVELPIYLGANSKNMSKGAAILGQTSMPIGGNNTNTVLAAHRGWKGTPMFRNIQMMQIGDKIQITTPWDTLIYRVCELKIVLSGDSHQILLQKDRELITLLTCHPYTKNTHRYLVFAERSYEDVQTMEADLIEAEETYSEESKSVIMIDENGVEQETLVDSVVHEEQTDTIIQEMQMDGATYSNLQIWLEDYGTWIVLGIVVIVVLLMFRSRKKRWR